MRSLQQPAFNVMGRDSPYISESTTVHPWRRAPDSSGLSRRGPPVQIGSFVCGSRATSRKNRATAQFLKQRLDFVH